MRFSRRQSQPIRRQKQTGGEKNPTSPFFRKAIQRKEDSAPKPADDQLKDQNKETEQVQKKNEEPDKEKDKSVQTKVDEKEPAGETKLPKS